MNMHVDRSIIALLLTISSVALSAQEGLIEGVVRTERGVPLAFANVVIHGTAHGTTTNADGRFTLDGLTDGEYMIVASSVGYEVVSAHVQVPVTGGAIELRTRERVVDLPAFTVQNSLTGGTERARRTDGAAWYIGPKELEEQGYTDVLRVLRSVPGVNIQEEDGLGLRPNVGLRGAGAERSAKITVMEDGVLAAPAPYAAPAAYYFPTIGRMNGVEVVKGSSQIRHGPLTTGGALNMLSTPVPERTSGMVSLQGGSYGSRNIHAHAGTEHNGIGFLVETFQQATDGFKLLDHGGNTGTSKSDQMAKLQWRSREGSRIQHAASVKAGYTTESGNETYLGLSENDFALTPYRRYSGSQEDRITVEHDLFTAQYAVTLPSGPQLTFTGYRTNTHRNWYKLDKVTDTTGTAVGISTILSEPDRYASAYHTITGASSADNSLRVKANNRNYQASGVQFIGVQEFRTEGATHRLELGLRVHEDHMDRYQHTDGYRMEEGRMLLTDPGDPGTESNRIASADAVAAHFMYDLEIGRLGLRPGLRHERINMVDEDFGRSDPGRNGDELITTENEVDVWIPGIGLDMDITEHVNAFTGIHRGFSPPGAAPGTKPEASVNYEAGIRFDRAGTFIQLIGFLNDYSELLGADLAASGGTGTGDLFNGGEAMVRGLEFHISHDPLVGLKNHLRMPINLSYTYTDARFESTFTSTFEGWGYVAQGDRIPYIPIHQLNARIGIEGRKASISLTTTFVGEVPATTGTAIDQEPQRIPAFMVLDVATTYRWSPRIEVFASVQNVFDDAYLVSLVPAGSRPGAPRMIFGGMRFRF